MSSSIDNGRGGIVGWVYIVSDAFLVMCVLVFMAIFYVAYFNDFRVLVTVNHFHEANVEFVLFSLCLCVLLFRVFYFDVRKKSSDVVGRS